MRTSWFEVKRQGREVTALTGAPLSEAAETGSRAKLKRGTIYELAGRTPLKAREPQRLTDSSARSGRIIAASKFATAGLHNVCFQAVCHRVFLFTKPLVDLCHTPVVCSR